MANPILPRDRVGHAIQALAPEAGTTATGTVAGTSARVALPTGAEVVRVCAVNDCYIRFGDSSVTAAGTDALFIKGAEVFKVPAGATHLAFIQHTTGGAITVSSMV